MRPLICLRCASGGRHRRNAAGSLSALLVHRVLVPGVFDTCLTCMCRSRNICRQPRGDPMRVNDAYHGAHARHVLQSFHITMRPSRTYPYTNQLFPTAPPPPRFVPDAPETDRPDQSECIVVGIIIHHHIYPPPTRSADPFVFGDSSCTDI